MPAPLKDVLGPKAVAALAGSFQSAYPPFDAAGFRRAATRGLAALELTPRAQHLAAALHRHLPQPFPRAARVLRAALGPELDETEDLGLSPLVYLPYSAYVATYGLEHFEAAMETQYELTKRFTAEFCLRPYLERYPEETYARLEAWASDENVHVRRLVSEGTRPRLPWAPRLRAFQADPAPVLALLERLKDDPERYVQRSVANSLNDIGKDHPEVLVEVCHRWAKRAPAGRQWIIRHALRSLVKAAHPGALALLGAGAAPKVRVVGLELQPKAVRRGGTLRFELELESTSGAPQSLLVDYAVHFAKANGARKPKVFKLRRVELDPGAKVSLRGQVSFEDLSTRKHYAGRHAIELVVNGLSFPLAEFELRA